MKKSTKPSTCEDRKNQFLQLAAEAACHWYDKEGNWLPTTMPAETREQYWTCFALYANGRSDLANAMIRKARVTGVDASKPATATFNIFHTNVACELLVKFRKLMTRDVIDRLENLVKDGFAFNPGNRRPDYQFRGLNDNMPAKATMCLILGGEMLGNADAVEHGVWNLRQMRNMLVRRGTNSEYNSPTYSPLSIHAMAEIVEHARNAEARKLALGIEERLWIDLAARFHPELGVISGPHSRAYTLDTVAHTSAASGLLWFVLGDAARPSPLELFGEKLDLVLHHQGDLPFNIAQICWFAASAYHVPAVAKKLFKSRKYPFRAVAMAEVDCGGPDTPAGPMRIETYLQADYTVGTSSSNWIGSEQSAYFATYKKKPEVRTFRDVGTIFNKYTINGDAPGTVKQAIDSEGRVYANSGEQDNTGTRYNSITLQSGPTVMMVTHPSLDLAGTAGGKPATPLSQIDEMVIFPSHFGGADEVRIGTRVCRSWQGEAAHGEWIGCRRGQLLVAIRPLVYAKESNVAITLEKIHNYEVVRHSFYRGPQKTFTRTELGNFFGGFVVEHASVKEYPSLEAFMVFLSKASFTDYWMFTRVTRYRRPAGRKRPAVEMECAWSVGATVTRYSIINGLPVPVDSPVQIDGLKKKDFPFLNRPWTSVPSYFPWHPLAAIEYNRYGIVGDEET